MARRFRRKFRGRKYRKRSFRRRSYRRGNRSGRRANRIVSIKRTQLYQYYRNSGAPYLIQGAQSFRLADLPNYGEFQVLFQYYRIKWIKLEFVPNMSPEIQYATAVNGPTSSWGATDILYAKRHADGNQRDFNELLQIQSVKRRKVSQRFTTWLKPAAAQGVYNTTLRGVMRLSYLHGLTEIILVFLTMALHFRVIHQRTAISLFLLIIFSIATLRTM